MSYKILKSPFAPWPACALGGLAKLVGQRSMSAPKRPPDRARHQQSIEKTGDAVAWFVLHDKPVDEPGRSRLEMSFVEYVRQPRLRGCVSDEPVRFVGSDLHRQQPLATKQADDELRGVADSSPARVVLESHVAGPESRPIRDVRDEREAMFHRNVEAVCSLDSSHAFTSALSPR